MRSAPIRLLLNPLEISLLEVMRGPQFYLEISDEELLLRANKAIREGRVDLLLVLNASMAKSEPKSARESIVELYNGLCQDKELVQIIKEAEAAKHD